MQNSRSQSRFVPSPFRKRRFPPLPTRGKLPKVSQRPHQADLTTQCAHDSLSRFEMARLTPSSCLTISRPSIVYPLRRRSSVTSEVTTEVHQQMGNCLFSACRRRASRRYRRAALVNIRVASKNMLGIHPFLTLRHTPLWRSNLQPRD